MTDKLEQTDRDVPIGIFSRMLIIGVVGGILWSMLSVILYYFNFTEVAPKSFLLRPWLQTTWSDNWQGHIVSIIMSGIISLIPAIIYYIILKKYNSMWIGIAYGIALWVLLFYILQPLFPYTIPVNELSRETVVTTLCIFILYGTFTGYSISYDYHDMKIKQSQEKA